MSQGQTPPGWYHAEGDPPDTSRYWDGSQWVGDPVSTGPPTDTPSKPAPGTDFANTGFQQPDAFPPAAFGSPGPVPGSQPLVSAGARIGGRVIDAIVWAIISIVSAIPLIAVSIDDFIDAINTQGTAQPTVNTGLVFITGLISLALVVAYEVFMNTAGGTLGKRAISARVAKQDGSALDVNTALMRMVPYIIVQGLGIFSGAVSSSTSLSSLQQLIFFLVALAGLIMLFTDDRRQTPWDKVGKTIVVAD